MRKIIALGLVTTLIGCSQGHSTSGVEEEGAGPTVASTKTPKVVNVSRGTPESSRSHRWATSNIAINVNTAWSRAAAETWRVAGVSFRHGAGGGITFRGFSTARASLGWAQYRWRNNIIYSCDIFINPNYLHRYDITKTMAHEIGHCLGIEGHTPSGLMSKYGGNDRLTQSTINLVRSKYARRAPPKKKEHRSNGTVRLVSDR